MIPLFYHRQRRGVSFHMTTMNILPTIICLFIVAFMTSSNAFSFSRPRPKSLLTTSTTASTAASTSTFQSNKMKLSRIRPYQRKGNHALALLCSGSLSTITSVHFTKNYSSSLKNHLRFKIYRMHLYIID